MVKWINASCREASRHRWMTRSQRNKRKHTVVMVLLVCQLARVRVSNWRCPSLAAYGGVWLWNGHCWNGLSLCFLTASVFWCLGLALFPQYTIRAIVLISRCFSHVLVSTGHFYWVLIIRQSRTNGSTGVQILELSRITAMFNNIRKMLLTTQNISPLSVVALYFFTNAFTVCVSSILMF